MFGRVQTGGFDLISTHRETLIAVFLAGLFVAVVTALQYILA